MKSRPLLAIALLIMTSVSGFSATPSYEEQRERLHSLRNKPMRKTLLDLAYLDTYRLLGDDSMCGRFFGSGGSRQVLEDLVIRLHPQTITDTKIGIRMSGSFTSKVGKEGINYRVFENSELNNIGAFYRSKTFPSEPLVPNMGSFRPNTREARVLILLHELAHLITGTNGAWLIPDDGHSPTLSRINTLTIESKCGQDIRAL